MTEANDCVQQQQTIIIYTLHVVCLGRSVLQFAWPLNFNVDILALAR